jgi:hypothetical protein
MGCDEREDAFKRGIDRVKDMLSCRGDGFLKC